MRIHPINAICFFFERISRLKFAFFAVGLSLSVALIVRAPYIISADLFPLGDGGLFVAMINGIKANHFLIPKTIEYNHTQIPFAYPPLGFYLTIFVSRILGAPTLLVVRFLPLAINLLTVAAFVLLVFEFVEDRSTALIASVLFPVVFQTYQWTIKGGGIARSPGFLFALLTLLAVCKWERHRRARFWLLAIFALSAAILSHPEWALVSVVFVGAHFMVHGLTAWRQRLRFLFALGIGSALITSPWWGTVIARFGIEPLWMAGNVARMDLDQLIGKVANGGLIQFNVTLVKDYYLSYFALLGIILSLFKKNYFPPIWLMAAFIASPKNAPIPGIASLVLLTAIGIRGVDETVRYLVRRILFIEQRGHNSMRRAAFEALSYIPFGFIYLLAILPLILTDAIGHPILHSILPGERAAMSFISQNVPEDATFVVITPYEWYEADAAEWFPLLAERRSLTTPQGLEWVSAVEFNRIVAITKELSGLVREEQRRGASDKIIQYVEERFDRFEYIVVFVKNADRSFGGFVASGKYEIIYLKSNAVIFKRVPENSYDSP